MSLTADQLQFMLDRGLTLADAVEFARLGGGQPVRSAAAERQERYRERLAATGMTSVEWRATSARIISRDGGVCQYCGTAKGRMACDHVVPLSAGGSSADDNLVCACHACNGGKSGRTLTEWMGEAEAADWMADRVTSRDITPPKQKVSPTPPSKTHTPSSPPIVPPTKGDLDAVAERIWALQPKLEGKRRQTKPDVRKALSTVLRNAKADDVEAACRAYYALPASTKEGGAFAMGAARLLQNDRWREFLGSDAPAQRVNIAPFPDEQIRNAVISAKGEAWTASWLDPCVWDEERRAIVPRNGLAAQKLKAEVSRVLSARQVQIQEMAA